MSDGEMQLPRYGEAALADLLPAVAASLGVTQGRAALSLPAARTYVVVLIDGFGWEQLHRHADQAPFLARLGAGAAALTAGCPSTTATSLTSLGTGLVPGQHGIVGFRFRLPGSGEMIQPLTWNSTARPEAVQPNPTVFEAVEAAGRNASLVVPERFDGSGLTAAALRGARVFGLVDEDDDEARIEAVEAAVSRGRGVVYCYYRALDHTGHGRGVGSAAWRARLTMVDAFCEDLRDRLPADVAVLITGDHGMVDVPEEHRVTVEDTPELIAGVDAVGGEARFRQLYTRCPDAVAARWREFWGERAWVATRPAATDAGWFGPVAGPVRERIGDVVVALRGDWAAMTTELPQEFGMVGMHGSLTAAEMLVPLLVASP